ncbi:hypothetical protein HN592_05200 [Candidatus Woesearchaeota archaeon]|jgi:hypothetical protein|nr:hypothetical protein [Candidatus Woesearchaeota archaeon]MBT4367782.1 hypothetical protein [Candidatus Woesearchaeota archaeon]MBT4712270.1 hypothetical protein [Candidatus Woesearchaeota archaeon]MBT6638818.1 hypothetical protein [Candidatus Woesearchaeota archaeon]MBT7134462.1 hypothetical protein [Candidatus Woesearchaeota archaeon]
MTKLPQIKKKLSSFLTSEEGKISKKAAITLSLIAAGSAAIILSTPVEAGTTWTFRWAQHEIHHASHSSY